MKAYEKRAWLRPLGSGELVDTALRLYQRSAKTILKVTAVPMVLCYAALIFTVTIALPTLFVTRHAGNLAAEAWEVVVALGATLLAGLPLFALGIGWCVGAVSTAASDLLHGRQPDEARAQAAGRQASTSIAKGLVSILLSSCTGLLVAGALSFAGMLLDRQAGSNTALAGLASVFAVLALGAGVITAPFLLQARALAPVISALEGAKPSEAIARSKWLMKRHSLHPATDQVMLATVLILLFTGGALYGGLQSVLELSGAGHRLETLSFLPGVGQLLRGAVESLPLYAALWLTAPLWSVMMTVLYYDRIVRLEAYDVQVMNDDIVHANRRSVLLR